MPSLQITSLGLIPCSETSERWCFQEAKECNLVSTLAELPLPISLLSAILWDANILGIYSWGNYVHYWTHRVYLFTEGGIRWIISMNYLLMLVLPLFLSLHRFEDFNIYIHICRCILWNAFYLVKLCFSNDLLVAPQICGSKIIQLGIYLDLFVDHKPIKPSNQSLWISNGQP